MYTISNSLNCGCILHVSEPQVVVSLEQWSTTLQSIGLV